MQCPKCSGVMSEVSTAAGVVDRCEACTGLWFDMLEDQDQKLHAAQIDTGDAATGAAHNQIDRIKCPRCPNSWLVRMVDAAQPHIWFESCPTCYGRYFDAGEFRDLADYTLSDWWRSWSVKPRTLM